MGPNKRGGPTTVFQKERLRKYFQSQWLGVCGSEPNKHWFLLLNEADRSHNCRKRAPNMPPHFPFNS